MISLAQYRKLTKSQRAAIAAHGDRLALRQREEPADGVDIRWTGVEEEDGTLTVTFEAQVINADTGYESGWYWVDGILVTNRGRVL